MPGFRRRHHARRMGALALAVLSLLVLGGLAAPVVAQDATPPGTGAIVLPFAAPPDLCTADPRPMEDYEALLGTPSAGDLPPTVIEAGTPVDQATADGIVAALVEIAACQSAGNFRALDSLYTDAGFIEDSGGGIDQEGLNWITASPQAAEEAQWQVLYSATNIQRLDDGRIAVIAQWGPNGIFGIDLMIFVEQEGTFLIDKWVDEPFDITPNF